MSRHGSTIDAARGKWRGILMRLGVPERALVNKHGPCPLCGGKDRFRFDNKEGRGTWFCNACGAGDGMQLAMRSTGKSFAEAAAQIDGILGNGGIRAEKPPAEMTEEQRRALLREVWAQSVPVCHGDLVDRYLSSRGLSLPAFPKALRFARSLRDGDGGVRPAMLSVVQDAQGQAVTLHKTFLRPDGKGKAEMEAPRRLMPGSLPDGATVRLSDYTGGPLGVAEGIETALAASALFNVPVWAALNATMLGKWQPPDGCTEVIIFADNDRSHAGQAAAHALAQRLFSRGVQCRASTS